MAKLDSGIDFNTENEESSSYNKTPEHTESPKDKERIQTPREIRLEQEKNALNGEIKMLERKCEKMEKTIISLEKQQKELKNFILEIKYDLGELHFHQTVELNRKRESEQFREIYGTNRTMTESPAQREDTSLGSSSRENRSETMDTDDQYPISLRIIPRIPIQIANPAHDQFSADTRNAHTQQEIQLQQDINALKQKKEELKQTLVEYGKVTEILEERKKNLKKHLTDITADHGELLFEETAKEKEKRNAEQFQRIFGARQSETASTIEIEGNPATENADKYKTLLLTIAKLLLPHDVKKLKSWAEKKLSVANCQNATDVLYQFDRVGFISASNLGHLRDFFESILRIDVVCILDGFMVGDYSFLRTALIYKQDETTASEQK